MSSITTHVLDMQRGKPAQGMNVVLEERAADGWHHVASGTTDDDGRANDLGAHQSLNSSIYRLTFDTDAYSATRGEQTFYPEITIVFRVDDPRQDYHVPLLLNPFGFTTYRGC